ncbi:MAG: hypothetical protein HY791_11675 [Deltaproteobacteria bacterium]|nr:hypothetical protein [Deltaproteobacteria bacterium]
MGSSSGFAIPWTDAMSPVETMLETWDSYTRDPGEDTRRLLECLSSVYFDLRCRCADEPPVLPELRDLLLRAYDQQLGPDQLLERAKSLVGVPQD